MSSVLYAFTGVGGKGRLHILSGNVKQPHILTSTISILPLVSRKNHRQLNLGRICESTE